MTTLRLLFLQLRQISPIQPATQLRQLLPRPLPIRPLPIRPLPIRPLQMMLLPRLLKRRPLLIRLLRMPLPLQKLKT
jgi:hypothetical protein